MSIHRYKSRSVNQQFIQALLAVGADVSVNAAAEIVDVSLANDAYLSDLNEAMAQFGYELFSGQPTGLPPQLVLISPSGINWNLVTGNDGNLSVMDSVGATGPVDKNNFFLEIEPPVPTNDYSNTLVNGKITNETWKRTSDASKIKTVDYTYVNNLLSGEVRKIYAPNGTTITSQLSIVYIYSGGRVVSATRTRDI